MELDRCLVRVGVEMTEVLVGDRTTGESGCIYDGGTGGGLVVSW